MAMLMTNGVFARTWGGRAGPAPDAEFWPSVLSKPDHGRGVASVFSWLRGRQAARSYQRRRCTRDVVAGLVLTTLLVPQGHGNDGMVACLDV